MPSLQPKLEQDNTRYTMPQLIQLRRQMFRFARSLPPGPERNGRRQIAASLRSWQLDRKVATFEHKPK